MSPYDRCQASTRLAICVCSVHIVSQKYIGAQDDPLSF